MPDALLIGLSGLSAQQKAMEVTSHNLANATTPGYTRQRAEMTTASPEDIKPGQFGRGVTLDAVRRISDVLVDDQLRQAEGESGRLTTLKANLLVVQQAFNEPGENGLSTVIGNLFSSFQDLAGNPESVAIRSSAVQAAQTYAGTVSDLGTRLSNIRDDLGTALTADITDINGITSSIAVLNQQIRTQVNLGNNPNDLLDSRQRLLGQLTNYLDAQIRINPKDQTAQVTVNGRMLVGQDSADVLSASKTTDGDLMLVGASGLPFDVKGGSVGALYDLHHTLLPTISAQLDELSTNIAREINGLHATGTSNAFRAGAFVSDNTVVAAASATNLDDVRVASPGLGLPGLPATALPDFTDAAGNLVARNLTINVVDTTTGIAGKYTLRWDPLQNNGARSLDDLVTAINTGVGGGWSVYPPSANGVTGVTARKVQVDGGFRLELKAQDPKASLDFSQALDLRPSQQAWTGTGTVAISGTLAPAVATSRLALTVNAAGTALDLTYRDPVTGQSTVLGSAGIPGSGTNTTTINGLTIAVDAGTFRAADRIGIAVDAAGAVLDPVSATPGTQTVTASWAAGDAAMTVRGRYTNTLSDPNHSWSAKVLTTGVIGAKAATAAPNNPPSVQFTFWTGSPDAPVQQVVTKVLDDSLPPNTPIQLADGVYVSFGAGRLSAANNRLDFTVDGQPDQAGLLPALGINSFFSGGDHAQTLHVADRLVADPSQIALATTRNEGDNSNLTAMMGVRQQKLFTNGSFTLDDFYQGLLTDVGVRIQQSDRLGQNQDALKASLSNMRESISGVSIDEEVGRLIQQQQAYSAAARVVSTARENVQTLLDILR